MLKFDYVKIMLKLYLYLYYRDIGCIFVGLISDRDMGILKDLLM